MDGRGWAGAEADPLLQLRPDPGLVRRLQLGRPIQLPQALLETAAAGILEAVEYCTCGILTWQLVEYLHSFNALDDQLINSLKLW